MASGTDRTAPAGPAVALAVVSSALLYFFGTGLHPGPWLTWLAPLPILLLAPRVAARTAALATFAACLLGGANIWHYYAVDLGLPAMLVLLSAVLFPVLPTAAALLFRAILLRNRHLLAAVAFPACIAGAEYLVSVATPAGANWSLAPTQADLVPVLQVAGLTGGWGISFLVSLVPAVLAVLLAPRTGSRARWRVGLSGVLALGLALGYGAVRVHSIYEAPRSPRITLVSARSAGDAVPVDSAAGRELVAAYADWLRTSLTDDTRIVVLPEKGFQVDDDTLPDLLLPLAAAAGERGVDLVVGVEMHTGGLIYNTAVDLPADGREPVVYRKHHLVPGVEDHYAAGTDLAFVPGFDHRIGIAICADLGHPGFGRAYGRAGAGLLVAPALDFTVDAWSQSRVQLLRGVESGFSVARAARLGYLTLSEPTGRVVAQEPTGTTTPFVSVSGTLAMPAGTTLYARWGDWFAWVCLALVGAAVAGLGARSGLRRQPGTSAATLTGPADRPQVAPVTGR